MTNLDHFLAILSPKCTPMTAIQITPQTILLIVNQKEFWNCLRELKKDDIKLKFLEVRNRSLDIHFSYSIQKYTLLVTFRVIDYSQSFIQKLTGVFPSTSLFIQDLE